MTNFDTAVEATEDALNSEGSATEENEKRKKSLQGRVTELDSAFQKLARDTVNSDFVKFLISAGTAILKFIDDMGGLQAILPAIISLIVSINATKILSNLNNIGKSIKNISQLGGGLQGFSLALKGIKPGSEEAATALKLLNSTGGKLIKTFNMVTFAISTGLAIGSAIVSIQDAIKEKKEKEAEETQKNIDTNIEASNSLKNLKDEYNKIQSSTVDSTKKSEELAKVQEKLNELYEDNNLDVYHSNLEDVNEELDKMSKTKAQNAVSDINAVLASNQGERNWKLPSKDDFSRNVLGLTGDTISDLNKVNQQVNNLRVAIQSLNSTGRTSEAKKRSEELSNMLVLQKNLENQIKNTKAAYDSLYSLRLSDGITITDEQLRDMELLGYNMDDYRKKAGMASKAEEDWAKCSETARAEAEKRNVQLDESRTYTNDFINGLDDLSKELSTYTMEQENSNITTAQASANMNALSSELDGLQTTYDTLKGAVDEYNKNGYMSIDTLQQLLSLGDEYLSMLSMENGQLVLNTTELDNKTNALIAAKVQSLQAAAAEDLHNIALGNTENISNLAKNAIVNLGSETSGIGATFANQVPGIGQFTAALLGAKAAASEDAGGDVSAEVEKNMNAVVNAYKKAYSTITSLGAGVYGGGGYSGSRTHKYTGGGKSGKSGSSKSGKSASETYKAEVDALYAYNNALDIAKDRVDALNDALKNTDNFEEQEKYIRQLIDALNDQIAKTNDLKNAQTNQINDYINQLRQQGFSIDYNASKNELYINNMQHLADFTGDSAKNVEKIIKKIQELNKDNRSLDSSIRDLTKSTKDYYDKLADLPEEKLKKFKELLKDFQQSQLDQVQNQITDLEHAMKQDPRLKALEEQIEALENQNDELDKQKELEEKLLAVEEAKEKLANQKKQKNIQIFRENQGFVWESDIQEIEDAQKDLEDAQKDLNDKIKQDQLDALNAEKDALEKSYQDRIDKLQEFLDEQNYQIDKANRNAIQTFQELQEEMAKFGLDNAEYLSQATNWLNNYNAALSSLNNTVNSLMGFTTANGTLYSSSMQDRISTALSSIMPEITSTGLTLSNVGFSKLTGDNSGQTIYIDKIELPNVKDANDFVEALKDLPRIAASNVTNRR